jgi:hypothetical protein
LGNIRNKCGKLLAVADFNAVVYGAPSEELLRATAAFGVKVYVFFHDIGAASPIV